MPIPKLQPFQVIEHRLRTTLSNLPMQLSEIFPVSTLHSRHFKRGIPTFISPSRNYPPWLCQHHHMQIIGHLNKIDALPFNWQSWFCYHALKPTNTSLVTTPISLISNKQHTVL